MFKNIMDSETCSLFLNLLFTPFQDSFSSYEMVISVGGAKTEVLLRQNTLYTLKHTTQGKEGLNPHTLVRQRND